MEHEMSVNGVKWSVTIHIAKDTTNLGLGQLLSMINLSLTSLQDAVQKIYCLG